MRILIFSDSHGDGENLRWMAELAARRGQAQAIIHCGDGLRDFEGADALLARLFPGSVRYGVKGNCDFGMQDAPNKLLLTLGGVPVCVTHGHMYSVKSTLTYLAASAKQAGCRVALFGHTHLPTLEEREGILLLNPGTATKGYAAILEVDSQGGLHPELLSF